MEFSGTVPALPREWDAEGRWTTILEGRWHWDSEHINIKEGRTTLMLLRRLGRVKRARHHRVLGIGDNLVSLCSFEKGRAKSWSLNSLCRRPASYQIAPRLRWQLRHVDSKRNPCDAGSRRHGLPEALPLTRAARPGHFGPGDPGHIFIAYCTQGINFFVYCMQGIFLFYSTQRNFTTVYCVQSIFLIIELLLAQVSTPGYTGLVCACPRRGLP